MRRIDNALPVLGALAGAGALWAWLVAPGKYTDAQRGVICGRNFAHRGLYDANSGVPENSLAAFRAAAAAGYGAELDVHLSRDGVAVVAHDDDLFRMTGEHVVISASDYARIRALRLGGTDEPVPRLDEALDVLCAAQVPVIVEVKSCARARRPALCRAVLDELDARGGEFCVESFDPMIVRWFRHNAPDLLRGQLTAQRETLDAPPAVAYAASRVLYNCLGRPQFIAHRLGKKTASVRLAEAMGALRVCWTAHDSAAETGSDAVIFEHYLPRVRYL